MTGVRCVDLRVLKKQGSYWRQEHDFNEISSKVKVLGVSTFGRQKYQYQHPVCIIGAGFGGASSAVELLREGYDNFVVFDRHPDFGGHSWVAVANKHTKLQTEKGTYHINYTYPDFPCPDYMPVWPSRDQLLEMFRRESRGYGLEEKTLFGTEVVKVSDKGNRIYEVKHQPVDDDSSVTAFTAGAVVAWPGNLCYSSKLTLNGEDDFGGYIEYGSEDRTDYPRVKGQTVLLYGHGAFMIENVRTLMEHAAIKVWIVCRKRNLTAPKMVSWLMSQTAAAATGVMLLKAYEPMYKLAGFDPWTAHSVICDKDRSVARITQKTVFGVTDVYFLALYYGRAEVVIDEVKRLSFHTAHLKKGGTLPCEVILKVLGISADPRTDAILGVQELVGYWVQGDPLRPCCCNGLGVNAQNFVSFSVGPAIAGNSITVHHFLVYPNDLYPLLDSLPRHRATDGTPAYVPEGTHWLQTGVVLGSSLPQLAVKQAHLDSMKSHKQHVAHPLQEFLAECQMEWQMYIEMFGTDDKPPPPYPYTEEMIIGFIEEIYEDTRKKYSKGV